MDPKELIKDEAFKVELENAKNVGEIVELLKSKGVEVTEEMITKVISGTGELDEGNLEGVAGGRIHITRPGIRPDGVKKLWDWICSLF